VARERTPSAQTRRVLETLAADPARTRYGYELSIELNLSSGTLYPILMRLADRGLVAASWEAHTPGRPPRHLYRLTAEGAVLAAQLTVARRPVLVRRPALVNGS
jgi:PadR family transcriptional regulator, regulatory protein PadR